MTNHTPNTYMGHSGQSLLQMVSPSGRPLTLDGRSVNLIPRTLSYANQAEICPPDEAEAVGVQRLVDGRLVETLVRV